MRENLKSEFREKHTETCRTLDCTRLRILGTVLKSQNHTVQQYDLSGSDDNLGTCRYYTRIPSKLNRTIADPAELRVRTQNHTEFPMRYANVVPKGTIPANQRTKIPRSPTMESSARRTVQYLEGNGEGTCTC